MSWKASGYVKELREGLSVTEKFVLLILAEYHRTDEKLAWPSVATLAADCLMTERGVQQILARLIEKEFIVRSQTGGGRGHISGYRIVGVDGKKDEQQTPNGHAGNTETPHSHSVKGERNPAQPTYRNKEEPVLEPVEPEDLPTSSDTPTKKQTLHQECRTLIEKFYEHYNPGEKCPWSGAEGKQLSNLLGAKPDTTAVKLRKWLWNYSQSENVVLSKRPAQFLPNILNYASTALDRFGQAKGVVNRPTEPWAGGIPPPTAIERLRAQTGAPPRRGSRPGVG